MTSIRKDPIHRIRGLTMLQLIQIVTQMRQSRHATSTHVAHRQALSASLNFLSAKQIGFYHVEPSIWKRRYYAKDKQAFRRIC